MCSQSLSKSMFARARGTIIQRMDFDNLLLIIWLFRCIFRYILYGMINRWIFGKKCSACFQPTESSSIYQQLVSLVTWLLLLYSFLMGGHSTFVFCSYFVLVELFYLLILRRKKIRNYEKEKKQLGINNSNPTYRIWYYAKPYFLLSILDSL